MTSKALEALERIRRFNNCEIKKPHLEAKLIIIESALKQKEKLETENAELKARNEKLEKVWDICLKKEVNIVDFRESVISFDMIYRHYVTYQKNYSYYLLTEEEFNLIKEWLEWKD